MAGQQDTEVAVIGGGPGGYVAAIRAADLGKRVVLIEEREQLGGVCLIEGCIPSKALINVIELAETAKAARRMGLTFNELQLNPDALRKWSDSIVDTLTKGVDGLLKRRGVEIVHGRARFNDNRSLTVETNGSGGSTRIGFRDCIIATGSNINRLPTGQTLPLWTSAEALRIPEVPARLLVVGGGYIGLEMGSVYAGLGSQVTIVEFFPRLLPGADHDLVDVVVKACQKRFARIMTDSKVIDIQKGANGYLASIEQQEQKQTLEFDQVLVAVGRHPNSEQLGLESTNIRPNKRGFIEVNPCGRTADEHIYAIGDVTPGPMLAHKASHDGKVAAEFIAQHPAALASRAVPAVVFTDPEVAWTGLTEREAAAANRQVSVARFPMMASGRARTLGRTEGMVKIISDPDSRQILGVGMVGPYVSELIGEGTLAVQIGITVEDLLATIHPHPTISETIGEAAEVAAGMPVHINPLRRPDASFPKTPHPHPPKPETCEGCPNAA
ncbi:MAG TPA: dihydrolipoyl dehydrogenase [Candidatus Baltobacteraceae bacterium]|nr:dihydrolipoyl dehydrogenase [Candidatus Baltobacteraceae bacterium]